LPETDRRGTEAGVRKETVKESTVWQSIAGVRYGRRRLLIILKAEGIQRAIARTTVLTGQADCGLQTLIDPTSTPFLYKPQAAKFDKIGNSRGKLYSTATSIEIILFQH